MTGENAWRPAIAALANDTAREVYARIVIGEAQLAAGLSPSRARSALAMLVASGLVIERDGRVVPDVEGLHRMLRTTAPIRPTGVERFLRPDGRIDRYPTKASERAELLAHVAARVLVPGEVVTERELTDRLTAFADDIALLRRHLVDHGVVERTPSGSRYALPAGETPVLAETSRQAVGLNPSAASPSLNAVSEAKDAASRPISSGRR